MGKYLVAADPESGMHLETLDSAGRKRARKYPSMYRICDVPYELTQRYMVIGTLWSQIDSELAVIFDAAEPKEK